MRERFDEAVLYIQTVLPDVIFFVVLGVVILSVVLAFIGRVDFSTNRMELGGGARAAAPIAGGQGVRHRQFLMQSRI